MAGSLDQNQVFRADHEYDIITNTRDCHPVKEDDGLTSLSWLQNLNMCRLGAPTPPTPPASPNSNKAVNLYNNMMIPMDSVSSSPVECPSILPHMSSFHHEYPAPKKEKKKKKVVVKQETDQEIDYKKDGSMKPPYSYATLICMAMKDNRNKMTLNSIYKWIRENFLYYQKADPSWQVRIRIIIPWISFK